MLHPPMSELDGLVVDDKPETRLGRLVLLGGWNDSREMARTQKTTHSLHVIPHVP